MANSSLAQIRTKIRYLTRSLSVSQLSDQRIDDYINTFVQYDFPEHLRLFNLRSTYEFFTEPYKDVYTPMITDDTGNQVSFSQKYLNIYPPVYIAGYQAMFTESREQFFGIYPMLNSIQSIGVTGDGIVQTFTGVINSQQQNLGIPVPNQNIVLVRENVLFSSIDTNNNGLAMIDSPINAYQGNLYVPGTVPPVVLDPNNNINYITGAFTVTFLVAPGAGQTINSQTIPVQTALPQAILFYNDKFTVRPVPNQPYRINMEVLVRPTELLNAGQSPQLQEWWQYIAFSASKKIFEDRMDYESLNMMMPALKEQEVLILRRTIDQQTSQRAETIYSQSNGTAGAYGPGFFSGGGSF